MKVLWFGIIVCLLAARPAAAREFTYVDLAKRLIDLEALAALPAEGERCEQWSSYDRASRYDAATGKYINWDANDDGQGIIRTEGDQIVMAEMEGPGCIWRIWSAAPKAGHVRIYLDGASEPTVDLPFSGYFDRQNQPFVYPSLVYDAASGKNCYIPIPYQKSCKITADAGWGNYYHFGYTTFPKGTKVPAFRRELSSEEKAALEAVDAYLTTGLGTDPAGKRKGESTEARSISIPPGGRSVSVRLDGPRAITAIRVKVPQSILDAGPDPLREVVMRIYWDGESKPSVWVPLIDFFGTAPNPNLYKSLPAGVTADGFYAFWYMPFANGAVVEFANDGAQAFPMEFSITHAPLARDIRNLTRFHAKWHRDAFLPSEVERWLDWTMLKTQGRGRFCGVALHLWVPTGGWWGEGDEKLFVDGEKLPSTFGTGSEDYFGYAWGNPALFTKAFHNQTRSDNNAGHVALNRWHISDNVPFHQSFEGYIEKYRGNARPALYSCAAFWYLAPGGTDPYGPTPVNERLGYYVMPRIVTREGEKLDIQGITGGKLVQLNMGGEWSEGSSFEWQDAEAGDELTFLIPIRISGRHRIVMRLTKGPTYGKVQVLHDGKPLGEPIDLYAEAVAPTGSLTIGSADMTSGDQRITVRMLESSHGSGFGIDYVKLAPSD